MEARPKGLADHLRVFDEPGFEFGRWVAPVAGDDGVTQLGWYSLSPAAEAFVRDSYDLGWVVDFDWPTWIQTPDGGALADPAAIGKATEDELAKLLTTLIRQDRFAEGGLAAAFESGMLTAILRRANELAGGSGSGIGPWQDRPWGEPWTGNVEAIAVAEAISEIGLGRGMCYGPCPAYAVRLRRSGHTRFDGEHFVNLMGRHRARISGEDFAVLALAVAHLRFESLSSHYAVDYTDAQATTTWIVRGGRRHSVEDYGGAGPDRLHVIEDLVDAAAAELAWTPYGPTGAATAGALFVGLDVDEHWRPPVEDGERFHWTQSGARPTPSEGRRSTR